MFRRLIHEHWHDVVPVVAFILTFAVFVTAFIRALLARKETVARLATLPLDPVQEHDHDHDDDPGPGGCADGCRRCPGCRRHESPSHL